MDRVSKEKCARAAQLSHRFAGRPLLFDERQHRKIVAFASVFYHGIKTRPQGGTYLSYAERLHSDIRQSVRLMLKNLGLNAVEVAWSRGRVITKRVVLDQSPNISAATLVTSVASIAELT